MNRPVVFPSFAALKLLRRRKITDPVLAKIEKMQPQPVLYFAFAQVMQIGLPVPVFNEIVGHVFG